MLDTREEMAKNAPGAESTNTKQALGLLIAQIVHQTPPLQLAASQIFRADVTLVILGQTEPHARSAVSINTKQEWGRLLALLVHLIQFLQLAAS